jgi:hypothetical protein
LAKCCDGLAIMWSTKSFLVSKYALSKDPRDDAHDKVVI